MTTMPKDILLDYIDSTLAWASDVSEMWAGTLHEKLIDNQQAQLIKAVDEEDFELAYKKMCDLAQMLDFAEKEYRKVENINEGNNGETYEIHSGSNDTDYPVR